MKKFILKISKKMKFEIFGKVLKKIFGKFRKKMDPASELIPPLVRDDSGTRGGINSRNSVDRVFRAATDITDSPGFRWTMMQFWSYRV